MTKWLASVQSLQEAQTLLPVLPDIMDMKNPSEGALGALNVDIVGQIVSLIAGGCQTSATIGDLPMQANIISAEMVRMATSGVDYIKIGLFPDKDLTDCITALAETVNSLPCPVIAVIFADQSLDHNVLPLLKDSGFYGVMVDTASKDGKNLLDHWSMSALADFVKTAQQHKMLCGLAGALRQQDIATLLPLGSNYLGFRSALCQQQQRTARLDLTLAMQVQKLVISA